jgi:hypothetical protein
MSSGMRRGALALGLVAALLLGACSDDSTDDEAAPDDSIPGSVDLADSGVASEEFCAEVEANAGVLDELGGGADAADVVAAIDQMLQDAPEVIVPSLETIRDTFDDSTDDGQSDLLNGQLIGAIEQVALFVEGECDLDLVTPSEQAAGGGGTAGGEIDPSALRGYLEEEDPDLGPRLEAVSAVDGLEINVTVRGLEVGADGDEAVAICEILSGYAYEEVGDPDLTLRVQTTTTDDVATREGLEGECTATPV